ncbi:2-amino-4-hydroxy-6-hydroxymethyldihydropteridine diphosphokinase [Thalassococcus sp. S3]|uniref:2-amino-4-hydroxy-6- hydroxymethyldihydropteridine diphosphokinase n=1 Tax=Thalassococcus sp. S3 TaxID=2017482 RepID=UPI0021103F7E|nr:2-amino-4-hydroxy-6-hydroxymethyldihydropteridine diphosphokinase [Thalassococcus sp. S3]
MGSNLPSDGGDPTEILHSACRALTGKGLMIRAISRFFRTPCFPPGAGPDYVNGVVVLRTDRSPKEVLRLLHEIEGEAGRVRRERWAARVLDLDLIAMDGTILPSAEVQERWRTLPLEHQVSEAPPELILPHPRLQDRAFVLVPLADVMPQWRHPLLGLNVAEMLERLPAKDRAEIIPL